MANEKVLTGADGSLFVQLNPDAEPGYVSCTDFDPLPDPLGDLELIRCRDGNNEYETIGERRSAPDAVSTAINVRTFPTFDVLDKIGRCPVNVFSLLNDCNQKGQFSNWVRGDVLVHASLTNRTGANAVQMEGTDDYLRTLDFTGWKVLHLANKLKMGRQAIAETTDLNAIAVDGQQICAGTCGAAQDAGAVAFLGGDAPAGSPTSTADIWQTDDGGVTGWTNTVGGAAHPFDGGYDIAAAGMFAMDRATKRWLAVREPVSGSPAQIAYSDDRGATWNRVTVGAVNNEGAATPSALFVRDRGNLWLATTSGNVYYSSDAGASWTLQANAVIASGGAQLNAIRFANAFIGWAAGNNDTLMLTEDGGDSWTEVTPPTSGANLTTVEAFDAFHAIVGTNKDGIFATFDAGAHWSSKTFIDQATGVSAGTVKKLVAYGDLVVWMIRNNAAGTSGDYHRSIDGGTTWEKKPTLTNAGLNDLVLIDANNAYVVGNAVGGTGFVAKITY